MCTCTGSTALPENPAGSSLTGQPSALEPQEVLGGADTSTPSAFFTDGQLCPETCRTNCVYKGEGQPLCRRSTSEQKRWPSRNAPRTGALPLQEGVAGRQDLTRASWGSLTECKAWRERQSKHASARPPEENQWPRVGKSASRSLGAPRSEWGSLLLQSRSMSKRRLLLMTTPQKPT